ncbi:hypothetical protein F2Q70_00035509 [Brassica cretica]|uniref:Uncharacterized protein n=1 Tax=Brassica cretica TaxID=69181 RepID=A0A8S9JX10_BRACR|nr:hypothetical protein F2Q70_00035509 [Brassica cretica]
MGEEMMETGRPVGHLGRVVKDPKSGNKFDVSELQDEENLSPAKKKHYYRHINSQIRANGSSCNGKVVTSHFFFQALIDKTSSISPSKVSLVDRIFPFCWLWTPEISCNPPAMLPGCPPSPAYEDLAVGVLFLVRTSSISPSKVSLVDRIFPFCWLWTPGISCNPPAMLPGCPPSPAYVMMLV